MEKQRALISGGSKGLGRAIALKFAENKLDVGIIGRDEKGLEETRSMVAAAGQHCMVIRADLSKKEEVISASEQALAHSPHWHVLVNNAGYASQVPLLELSFDDWQMIHHINLHAVFLLSQQMVPQMIERKQGKIINISSLGAFYGTKGMGAYGSSKAALNQLTRTMAVEWGPYNIQANAICPTVIMTDLGKSIWEHPKNKAMKQSFLDKIPSGRFGQPEDVANLAYFLASPASDFINGLAIPLDGGKTVMP